MIGRAKFLIFYLLGGLAAELVYIAMLPGHFTSEIPMGGASGAISACMGMYLLLRADADIEFKYFFWFIVIKAGEFEIPAWIAITFWFAKDLLWAVIGMMSEQRGGGVAFGAHVGGLLGGVALIAIYKWFVRRKEIGEDEMSSPGLIIDPAKIIAIPQMPIYAPANTSETPTIFLFDGAAQTGPFTLTQVQLKLRHGEISRDAQYWSEGMTAWESVKDLSDQPLE
jgi:hypothetical protein